MDLRWIDSLNRPTGMSIKGDSLIIADVNRVVIVDANTGKVLNYLKSSLENPGLNDVTIFQNEIFVSASFIHAIVKVEGADLVTWVQDASLLKWANGLYADEESLWVAGLTLNKIVGSTKKITPVLTIPKVLDFDGIASDGADGFLLTTVENSGLWHLNAKMEFEKLTESNDYFGDCDLSNGALFVARGNHSTGEYYISKFEFR